MAKRKRAIRRHARRMRKRGVKVNPSLNALGKHRFNISAMTDIAQPNDGLTKTAWCVGFNYPCRWTNPLGSYGTMGQPTPLLNTLMNTFDQYRVRKLSVTFYATSIRTTTTSAFPTNFNGNMVWTFNDIDDNGLIALPAVQSSGRKPFGLLSGVPITRTMGRSRMAFQGWNNCQQYLATPTTATTNYGALVPASSFGSMKFYVESTNPQEQVGRIYASWVVDFCGVISGTTPQI